MLSGTNFFTGLSGGRGGGAIFVHQGSVSITNSTLTANTAQGGGGLGTLGSHGGQALGGAIFNLEDPPI